MKIRGTLEMNATCWLDIKLKLEEKNKVFGWVLSDLETLEEWAKKLEKKLPPNGSAIPDELYLQATAVHILILSQFEYLLKSLGKIKKQWEIKNIIQKSNNLTQLEKDHLMYLFLTRHTLVHDGGHFDKSFFEDAKSNIKELKLEIPRDSSYSSLISPERLGLYINLIKKIILLDIAGNELSQYEKKVIEESLK